MPLALRTQAWRHVLLGDVPAPDRAAGARRTARRDRKPSAVWAADSATQYPAGEVGHEPGRAVAVLDAVEHAVDVIADTQAWGSRRPSMAWPEAGGTFTDRHGLGG